MYKYLEESTDLPQTIRQGFYKDTAQERLLFMTLRQFEVPALFSSDCKNQGFGIYIDTFWF